MQMPGDIELVAASLLGVYGLGARPSVELSGMPTRQKSCAKLIYFMPIGIFFSINCAELTWFKKIMAFFPEHFKIGGQAKNILSSLKASCGGPRGSPFI